MIFQEEVRNSAFYNSIQNGEQKRDQKKDIEVINNLNALLIEADLLSRDLSRTKSLKFATLTVFKFARYTIFRAPLGAPI